jgi:hypothetical protein
MRKNRDNKIIQLYYLVQYLGYKEELWQPGTMLKEDVLRLLQKFERDLCKSHKDR